MRFPLIQRHTPEGARQKSRSYPQKGASHCSVKASEGLKSVDQKMLEMAKIFRIPFGTRFFYIYRPAMKPFLYAGLKISLGQHTVFSSPKPFRFLPGHGSRVLLRAVGRAFYGNGCPDKGDGPGLYPAAAGRKSPYSSLIFLPVNSLYNLAGRKAFDHC